MKLKLSLILIGLIGINISALADEAQQTINQDTEITHFGIGALLGGLLAGPPGAIIGATGASWFGVREANAEKKIAALEKQLNTKSIELAYQQNELARTKAQYQTEFKKVALNQEIQSLEKLTQGINYVVYYKTNDANIRPDVRPQIQQLANLIKPYPQIRIWIEGHADRRGSNAYNLALSKERIRQVQKEFINAGINVSRLQTHAFGEQRSTADIKDQEAYVFDRRVTIKLTLNNEA